MPRPAKPYPERDWYITRAGGEYVKLCRRSEGMAKAKSLLRDHLKKRQQEKERTGGRGLARLTVPELFAMFLETVEAEKSPHTFADYQRWCAEFARLHVKRQARDVTRLDAQKFKEYLLTATWVREKQPAKPYKPKTINHAIISLRRAFNWAIDNELLAEGRNPFARLKLLPCQGRKRVATQAEYEALLVNCTDDHFRDVLIAMRYTPARPGDIRNLTWSMVEWDRRRWVIHEHKTSKTAREPKPLTIGMNEDVERMLRKRLEVYGGKERVFLNEDGNPWKGNALGLRMRRLRKRAGVRPDERGEEFVLYTQRHTFLTASGLDASIPEAVRVDLAGHTDGRTTRLYTHIQDEAVAAAGRRVADSLRGQSTPGK
jgi:integrase